MENTETKKGLGPLAWVGIGYGGIVLIIIIVLISAGLFITGKIKDTTADFGKNPELAAARLIVKLNPELEEVSYDENKGTITVREKKTGKTVTASLADLKEGKFSLYGEDGESFMIETGGESDSLSLRITTDEGAYEIASKDGSEKTPDWIPLPGNPTTEGHLTRKSATNEVGFFSFTSELDTKDIIEFYKQAFESAGYQTTVHTSSSDGWKSDGVVGVNEAQNLNITVAIEETDSQYSVKVFYSRDL